MAVQSVVQTTAPQGALGDRLHHQCFRDQLLIRAAASWRADSSCCQLQKVRWQPLIIVPPPPGRKNVLKKSEVLCIEHPGYPPWPKAASSHSQALCAWQTSWFIERRTLPPSLYCHMLLSCKQAKKLVQSDSVSAGWRPRKITLMGD